MTDDRPDPWGPFSGTGEPGSGVALPEAPSWRCFRAVGSPRPVPADDDSDKDSSAKLAALTEINVVRMINAALLLRRPLLVTGPPGSGKSTLARLVARELSLGPVLRWPITSSSQLRHGLYSYDAIGRIHDENRRRTGDRAGARLGRAVGPTAARSAAAERVRQRSARRPGPNDGDLGRYIRLGPLGTALLPWERPRVLLIDEIDKSDIDLPSDLLHVFEEGEFYIEELRRLPDDHPTVRVQTADRGGKLVAVPGGLVRCSEFPVVVLTSNDERTFPPAFLRRCLRLVLKQHEKNQLETIVKVRIDGATGVAGLIDRFVGERTEKTLATDQLLQAIYLISGGGGRSAPNVDEVFGALLTNLAE